MPVGRSSCDRCRAHKLKCQWLQDVASCRQCRNRNTPCVMPSPPLDVNQRAMRVTTNPGGLEIPSSSGSAAGNVEDRLKRLEAFIYELKSLPDPDIPTQNLETALGPSHSTTKKRAYGQIISLDQDMADFEARSRPRTDEQAVLPLPSYLQPRATGDRVSVERDRTAFRAPARLENCARKNCFLPPPNEGSSLVNEYLHDFNSVIPLFYPESIYNHVRDCYSGTADKNPLSWVLSYIALAIGHRLRSMSLFAADDDISNAEWYLNKCLGTLPDLLLHEPTLELIQALLGVAVLLQSSERSRKAALFVSTAMHMAQDLLFNESSFDGDEGAAADKQSRYVFWIAFYMDTALNFRSARPNTQRLSDVTTPLPNPRTLDWFASSTRDEQVTGWKVNFFALHVSLATIQAEVLEELFSVKAQHRSADLTANTFKSLTLRLETWKLTNPLTLDAPLISKSMYRSDIVHAIALEASYFRTLYQLQVSNALGGFARRVNVFAPQELQAAVGLIPLEICMDAHRLLELVALVSQGSNTVTWVAIDSLIPALCTALGSQLRWNELQSALFNAQNSDNSMQLWKHTLSTLEAAAAQTNDLQLAAKIEVCRKLYIQVQEGA